MSKRQTQRPLSGPGADIDSGTMCGHDQLTCTDRCCSGLQEDSELDAPEGLTGPEALATGQGAAAQADAAEAACNQQAVHILLATTTVEPKL